MNLVGNEGRDCWVSGAVLDAAQVRLVNARLESKLFLGPVLFQSVPADVPANLLSNFHGREQAAPTVAGL